MVSKICNSLFSGSQCILCDFAVFLSLYFISRRVHCVHTTFCKRPTRRFSFFFIIIIPNFSLGQNANQKKKHHKQKRNCCTCNWNQTANGILRFNHYISLVGNHKQNTEYKITNYSQNVMAESGKRKTAGDIWRWMLGQPPFTYLAFFIV